MHIPIPFHQNKRTLRKCSSLSSPFSSTKLYTYFPLPNSFQAKPKFKSPHNRKKTAVVAGIIIPQKQPLPAARRHRADSGREVRLWGRSTGADRNPNQEYHKQPVPKRRGRSSFPPSSSPPPPHVEQGSRKF